MHIPIMAAIQGFSMLSQALGLDGRSSATATSAAAKPGGSCVVKRSPQTDFASAMQLQDMMKSMGDQLTAAERQQVGAIAQDGNVQQALHLMQQYAHLHSGATFNAPGASPVFTYAPPKVQL